MAPSPQRYGVRGPLLLRYCMHIKANGITFNYQIDGAQDAPWLIFSNSLATNLAMWDEQARALSGPFRVLRYDQRGHGKTEAPPGDHHVAGLFHGYRQ